MGGKGPPPKPSYLRARTNKKPGHATLEMPTTLSVPPIPNPDERDWHPLTIKAWETAFASPMASQWLETDIDALGRLAMLWDSFYRKPNPNTMKEIRLQGQLFGLSPLDRSRLQWEVNRGDEADRKLRQRVEPAKRATGDPRALLRAVK
jgi:hypothetical protein